MDVNFNVSARMALLIGRESIPSSNGAIGEIVKNAYDADAFEVTVVFDVLYDEIPEQICVLELEGILKQYSQSRYFDSTLLSFVTLHYTKKGRLLFSDKK